MIKNFYIYLIISISVFARISFCIEVVLQNGLNGYDGCDDSHIQCPLSPSANYSSSESLFLQNYEQ